MSSISAYSGPDPVGGPRASGTDAGLSGQKQDLADLLHRQSAAIAQYRKMYDRASALARIGVWECDLATDRLTWTDSVYDLFELPRGAPLERAGIVAMYHEPSRSEMERLRADAIRRGGSFTLDIHLRTARGNDRWLRLSADVEQEDGRPVRIFGTKQDITEEKLAQDRLQALQTELIHVSRRSAMGTMATTLAHELNQPLAAIVNYVAATRRVAAGAGGRIGEGLDAIEQCALRASEILRGLRMVEADGEGPRQRVSPNMLIQQAATLVGAANGEEVDFRFELADGLAFTVDPVQILQVLINLLKNGCEAVQGAARREIRIASRATAGQVEIRIDDSGPGIAPEMRTVLFDAFVTSKPGGTGIGLSISRTIAEAHGGRITAANRRGGGASFRLCVPIQPDRADRDGALPA